MSSTKRVDVPSSILIIGSGVFGLSTAHSLCKNPLFKETSITLVDRQPFPTPDGSSIDTSRIIRPDYASPPYTRLASSAQSLWRTTFAPQHYHENGLCITASGPEQKYVSASLANVKALGTDKVKILNNTEHIKRVCGIANASGSTGYVNWSSGWADAEGAMRWLRHEVESFSRVQFIIRTVKSLLIDHTKSTVSGALLHDGSTLIADLTILAAGAWTPSLLDLRGICKATGQVLYYLPLSPSEEAQLAKRPTLLNLSTGLFMIPPSQGLLKIARHGHGYVNPTTIPHPEAKATSSGSTATITVSLPYTHLDSPTNTQSVPQEGQSACRTFLANIHPTLATPSRPFTKSRICWYTDTRTGDFLISYHPTYSGLFVATGGSGHAFKFLPVIGDSIVECVLGRTPEDFRGLWEWPKERVPEEMWGGDGSRGGPVGMVLAAEMTKGQSKL
ncbi:sarcosine oxidase [Clohesyomyces aquaticus]|uniref:Sarcosine oxidase n=1 Tax=Clohesyomyces aquaticus TaxID=1231657 RepID=A0A1Y1ZVT6_9PLEO|nr:sarcosine oxidase [Clohesyomyces aquaticus]